MVVWISQPSWSLSTDWKNSKHENKTKTGIIHRPNDYFCNITNYETLVWPVNVPFTLSLAWDNHYTLFCACMYINIKTCRSTNYVLYAFPAVFCNQNCSLPNFNIKKYNVNVLFCSSLVRVSVQRFHSSLSVQYCQIYIHNPWEWRWSAPEAVLAIRPSRPWFT